MATKRKTGAPPKPKPTIGVTRRALQMMVEHELRIGIEELTAKLAAEGYSVSPMTLRTQASHFRQSVSVLAELGELKGMEIEPKKAKAEKTPQKKAKAPKGGKLLKMLEGAEPVEKKAAAA